MINLANIEQLHAKYVEVTKRPLEMKYLHIQMWTEWMRYSSHDPFTIEDLALVVGYIRFKIKKGERKEESLRFQNLISSPDRFEEDRIDARAWSRVSRPTSRTRILSATGRAETQPKSNPETAAAVVKRCMEQFRKEVG